MLDFDTDALAIALERRIRGKRIGGHRVYIQEE